LVERAEEEELDSAFLVEVDQLVLECYELPARAHRDLAQYFEGMPAPEGSVRYPNRRRRAYASDNQVQRSTYGTVLDLRDSKLKLWIAGVTKEDGEWLPLPVGFPGSQLYPGATFEVSLIGESVDRARFTFQSESYLDLEDLVVSK
jgi:hypothetical protein